MSLKVTRHDPFIDNMLMIANDGPLITSTNYFHSGLADRGICYLTWNAGAARLLVPASIVPYIEEMATAEYVIVSRGPWAAQGLRDAYELMFEDYTKTPFCLILATDAQTDRLIPPEYSGRTDLKLTVWRAGDVGGQPVLTMAARYRSGVAVPCIKSWK